MIVAVGDIDGPAALDRDGDRFVEPGGMGGAVGKAGLARPRHGGHGAVWPDYPHLMVAAVGEVEAAVIGV